MPDGQIWDLYGKIICKKCHKYHYFQKKSNFEINGIRINNTGVPYAGIAGLDCWIVQSGLQSVLLDWIVIDNPISKLDFWFGLAIQQCLFNPNPKKSIFLFRFKKITIKSSFEAKPIFLDSVKKFGGCLGLSNEWSLGNLQFQKN